MSKKKGDLVAVRDPANGKFISGNPGRPKGSKNRITLLKAVLEEGFRADNDDRIRAVLDQVLDAALSGDKTAMKMVWEAAISKSLGAADKEAKTDKGFTVHHMHHDVDVNEATEADTIGTKDE